MDKKLETLYDLCETISNELEDANEKIRKAGEKLSAGDLEYIDKLTHSLKSIKTTIAMMEAEDKGYSGTYWDGRYYYDGETVMDGSGNDGGRSGRGMSNARGRGSNARRDSRGRYSSEYSRTEAREHMKDELRELMHDAPDEHTKKKFERFINEL